MALPATKSATELAVWWSEIVVGWRGHICKDEGTQVPFSKKAVFTVALANDQLFFDYFSQLVRFCRKHLGASLSDDVLNSQDSYRAYWLPCAIQTRLMSVARKNHQTSLHCVVNNYRKCGRIVIDYLLRMI